MGTISLEKFDGIQLVTYELENAVCDEHLANQLSTDMSKNLGFCSYVSLYALGFAIALLVQHVLVQHRAANEYLLLCVPAGILYYKHVGELVRREKTAVLTACFLLSFATWVIHGVAPGTFRNPFCGPISFIVCFSAFEGVRIAEPYLIEFKQRQANREL